MNRQWINRISIYLLGLLILALGLSLNTKAGLGVSAIISVSYSISLVTGINFGDTTFGLYTVFVILEIILHFIRIRRYTGENREAIEHLRQRDFKLVFLMDVLQIPLSIVFTRFLNVFSAILPECSQFGAPGPARLAVQFLALAAAIVCTGIGAAMSLDMRIIPNPGDGIVQAIADCVQKEVGFTKNCFDVVNIVISTAIGLACTGHLAGVGIGTVFAVIGVGRVIAVFNHLFYNRMIRWAGLDKK